VAPFKVLTSLLMKISLLRHDAVWIAEQLQAIQRGFVDITYLLTAIALTAVGSSTVHIYTQTVHRTTQSTQTIHRTTQSTQTIHRTTKSTQTVHITTQSTQIVHRTTQSTHST